MKRRATGYVPVIVRTALGMVFVYSGIVKIMDPMAFAGSIAAYKILPYGLNFLVAAILPWVETFSGLLLIFGARVKAASAIILLLNVVFIVALASTIARGLDIDCGCFRQGGEKTPAWIAIARDIAFFAAAAYLFFRKDPRRNRLK